ncbi:MAG: deoxyribonuclease IV [Gemmatimonadaceae bacterium]
MKHYFGAHTIDNGGIHMAARRAGNAGMEAMQLFTAVPKYYGDKSSIKPERVERFRAALSEAGIDPKFVMAHAAYVLNTATPDEEKYSRARAGLAKELERSTALGIGSICFHPGAATDDDREAAAKRVALAIVGALSSVPHGSTRVLVENTAGAGRTFAKTADEVGAILGHIPAELRSRTGYGLDTCHLFASGYDLREPGAVSKILDEFQAATGEPPGFIHLNDSEGTLGSNKDRHKLLGDGEIGTGAFKQLLADERSKGIPLILETPQENFEIADDDASPDPFDVRMIALLNELAS